MNKFKMANQAGFGKLSAILLIGSLASLLMGVLWFFNGLGVDDNNLVIKGIFAALIGLALGAISNFTN